MFTQIISSPSIAVGIQPENQKKVRCDKKIMTCRAFGILFCRPSVKIEKISDHSKYSDLSNFKNVFHLFFMVVGGRIAVFRCQSETGIATATATGIKFRGKQHSKSAFF